MPLGKLGRSHIQQAFQVLSELQELTSSGEKNDKAFINASNRFYTLIPHSFGVDAPVILKNEKLIKEKISMLESLMEVEIAYNLISSGSEYTVDYYYKQLKVDIEVLSKESDAYKMIEKYVQNTHSRQHQLYELVIKDIYSFRRHGEDERFEPFKNVHNHKLLWHGSRRTSLVGILSQGLRIAPPEVPSTGYMFGKGIYFADIVSKSANYCRTDPTNHTGLLVLCQVALGEMYEKTTSEYIEKLPEGKHSTKGVGIYYPNPSETVKIEGAVEVPLGKLLAANIRTDTAVSQ